MEAQIRFELDEDELGHGPDRLGAAKGALLLGQAIDHVQHVQCVLLGTRTSTTGRGVGRGGWSVGGTERRRQSNAANAYRHAFVENIVNRHGRAAGWLDQAEQLNHLLHAPAQTTDPFR